MSKKSIKIGDWVWFNLGFGTIVDKRPDEYGWNWIYEVRVDIPQEIETPNGIYCTSSVGKIYITSNVKLSN